MPNQAGELRYPKKLLSLKPEESFSLSALADICSVSERTVWRWHKFGYLSRTESNKYQVDPEAIPKDMAKSVNHVYKKFTTDELEDFYLKITKGEMEAVIDLGEVLRGENGSDIRVLKSLMEGLDDYRELIDYVIKR